MNRHSTQCPALRIGLHDYGGYPFILQLARSLARRGHSVTYLHGGSVRRPRARIDREADDGLRITTVGRPEPLHTRAGLRRLLQERRYARALGSWIGAHDLDVVISATGDLAAHVAAHKAARATRAGFVYWLQDVYSEAVGRLIARRLRGLATVATWPYHLIERRLARQSDAVIAITPDFLPVLRSWGVRDDKVAIIGNWAPLDELAVLPRENPWSRQHGLTDAPVFLYAGTLGRKHDPGLLVELASAVPDAIVLVVAEGTGADALRARPLPSNLRLLPLQAPECLAEMLSSADVLVALLEPDAGVFSVPSKVMTYLAAGKPILATIPVDNLATRLVRDADAGVVVAPGDQQAFIRAGQRLISDPSQRAALGSAGRQFAERTFDIDSITDRFESVLARVSDGTPTTPAESSDTDHDIGAEVARK